MPESLPQKPPKSHKSDSSTVGTKKTSDTSKDDKSSDAKSSETKGTSSDSESSDSGANESHDSAATSTDSSSSSSSSSTSSTTTTSSASDNNSTSTSSASSEPNRRWVVDYKTIEHPEESHMETVVVQEAWSESVPDYDLIIFSDGYKTSDRQDARRYLKAHDVSYSVQTVFKDIQHPAVTEQRKVVDRAAWTETVEDGGHWEYY